MSENTVFKTALVAGGMFSLVALLLFVVNELTGTPVGMHQIPAHPEGPDLLAAFDGKQEDLIASEDASKLASVSLATAQALEHEFTKAAEPNVKTGTQLALVRYKVRDNVFEGERLGSHYPDLPAVIEKFLDEKAGKFGGPLKPEQKKAWVEAFYKMSDCARYASARLAIEEHRKTCPHCPRFAERQDEIVCDQAIKAFDYLERK